MSESSDISPSVLALVCAAIDKQVNRDLAEFWDVNAHISAFPALAAMPIGTWPVIIQDNIGGDLISGNHHFEDGQPYAIVELGDGWEFALSHEIMEMLVDPQGRFLIAGDSENPNQPGRVKYLVEVCDPCQAMQFGYFVDGVFVSDFYTPDYFSPTMSNPGSGMRYSFQGNITEPREVLRGGYLSWVDPVTEEWTQKIVGTDGTVEFVSLGQLDGRQMSLRSQIDLRSRDIEPNTARKLAQIRAEHKKKRSLIDVAISAQAETWLRQISQQQVTLDQLRVGIQTATPQPTHKRRKNSEPKQFSDRKTRGKKRKTN